MENLTERMQEIWRKTKNQPKDIWFFYLFLLTFTLGVRKVILYFPIKRAFNEYSGVYVYVSDIFLCSTILVWITSILYNKISNTSSSRNAISEVIHRKDIIKKDEFEVRQKLSTGKISFIKAIIDVFGKAGLSWKGKNVPRGTISEKNRFASHCEISKMFHVEQFSAIISIISLYFRAILIGLVFIMLFDHYLWDIWQGQVLFWLVCGFLAGASLIGVSINCSTCLPARQAWNNSDQFGIFFIPLLLSVLSWLSLFWSENVGISFYRSVRFAELYLLFIYVALRFAPYFGQFLCNCSTWNKLEVDDPEIVPPAYRQGRRGTISTDNKLKLSSNVINNVPPTFAEATAGKRGTINALAVFFGVIIFLGVTQSLIGIAQFIIQHSLGLFWLKESLIAPNITGVAKIIVNNQPLMRAYGLFPHPNILGGFLFFSITITLLYKKMFHVEQFKKQDNAKCSTWNNSGDNNSEVEIVPRGTIGLNFINLILIIQVVGMIFSFSKSAILALLVALVYIIVPRGTILREKIKQMFHVEHFRNLVVLAGVSFLALYFTGVQFYTFFFKSLAERMLYLRISIQMISANPLIGVGTGQFTLVSVRLFPNLEIWQYQPVHNIFLLIWSEWGIVGLVLFIVFLWKLFHTNVPRR